MHGWKCILIVSDMQNNKPFINELLILYSELLYEN